ncbi:hypothetical protein T439DRAFT_384080 [Meredithblackwellia eburnea MCA 4105]
MSSRRSLKGKNVVRDDEDDEELEEQEQERVRAGGAGADEKPVQLKFDKVDQRYLNQPVEPKLGDAKIKSIIAELRLLKKELEKSLEVMTEAATEIAESLSTGEEVDVDQDLPEDGPQIKQLDREFKLLLDKIQEIDIRSEVLVDIKNQLAQEEEVRDIFNTYDESSKKALKTYTDSTSRHKYLNSKPYEGFRTGIWEALYGGRVPNLKKMIPAEEGDPEESDDEIEIGAQQNDFKCPITLVILRKAMSSEKCKHSFSHDAIKELLINKPPQSCPITGCSAKLAWSDMFEDTALQRRVEQFKRKTEEGAGRRGKSGAKSATQYATIEDSDDE